MIARGFIPANSPALPIAQRWFLHEMLQQPSTAASNSAALTADSLIVSTAQFSSTERLGIYQHAYTARLNECLENEYPVLRKVIGDDAFAQFARDYLLEHPSRSYTLGNLSARFVDFMENTRPPKESEQNDPDWFDIIIDLARLEETINAVFDGPGPEASNRSQPLTETHLQRWRPESKLMVNPSLRRIRVRFPVQQLYDETRFGNEWNIPTAAATILAVYRRDYVVRVHPLTEMQFLLFDELLRSGNLNEALIAMSVVPETDCTPRLIESAMRLFSSEKMILSRFAPHACVSA